MQIIDGYIGESHVTSTQVAWYHEGTNGLGDQVLPVGEQFAPTVQDINTIIVGSGMALVGGIRCEIAKGNTEPVSITTGAAGYSRHDLIAIRYTRNDNTQVENASLVVIEGTPATYSGTDNAEDPSYNDGDIQEGASVRDFPIYRVPIIETAVETPVPLFSANTTLAGLQITDTIKDALAEIGITAQDDLVGTVVKIAQTLGLNYIVEEGFLPNNADYYRKWNNGKLEVWGSRSGVSTGNVILSLADFGFSDVVNVKAISSGIYTSSFLGGSVTTQINSGNFVQYYRTYNNGIPTSAGSHFYLQGVWK